MITAKVVQVDEDLELCDVEVHENGEWVESCRSESIEDFNRRIKEFKEEYFQRMKERKG